MSTSLRRKWIIEKFKQFPALKTDSGHNLIIKLAELELTDSTMSTLQKTKIIAAAVRDRNIYIQDNWQTLDERIKCIGKPKKIHLVTHRLKEHGE